MSQLVFGVGMNAPLGPTLTSKIMTVCRPSCSRHANGTSAIFGHSHDADARCCRTRVCSCRRPVDLLVAFCRI